MSDFWAVEAWRALILALAAAVFGWVVGHLLAVLLLFGLGYVIWLLASLSRLEQWLREDREDLPEAGNGLLAELYHHVYRLYERQRRRERRLSDALNRFQQSAAALPDATVVLRANGEIEWFNTAAKRLLGLSARQDLGQRIDNLVRHPEFMRFFNRGDYSEVVEFPSPLDDGIMLAVQVVPYGDDQRLMVARDVTTIHRLEQVRRDFVANVSHELRTPLTVIRGYLETMAGAEDECAKQWGRSLEFMSQHTERMQHLVEDLLLLSRLETEPAGDGHEEVSVPALLAVIREEARALSGRKAHKIELDCDPTLWLRGKSSELRSLFSNLVTNAVRYTPDGGTITIRWYADGAGAHYQVRDTGIGIPERHLSRLTERFYRVDSGRSRQQGGTGLGLAIVKHVLQRHGGGELHVRSTEGEGSTFTCDFPRALIVRKPAAAEAPPSPQPSPPTGGRGGG